MGSSGSLHCVYLTQQNDGLSATADASVRVIDTAGNRYDPSSRGQRALDATGAGGQDLTTRMPPGGSFDRTVAFDVANESTGLSLVVNHGQFPGVIIIGDSQSFLHAPTMFRLVESDGGEIDRF